MSGGQDMKEGRRVEIVGSQRIGREDGEKRSEPGETKRSSQQQTTKGPAEIVGLHMFGLRRVRLSIRPV